MRISRKLIGLIMVVASGLALAEAQVSDRSFNTETTAVTEEVRIQRDSGAFGRAGDEFQAPQGVAGYSVGDRDMNRYVRRLGEEIRMRNALADAESRF